MRGEFVVVVLCSVLVLLLGFSFFDSQDFSATGNVVLSDSEVGGFLEEEVVVNVSREDLMIAFSESEKVIEEISEAGFSIVYMNDSLIEAWRILEQVDYAEILRGNLNGSSSDARAALRLINWKSLYYADVMIYLNDITTREARAFAIYDGINAVGKSLEKYADVDMSEAEEILVMAEVAFYEDRYEEAEELLNDVREEMELKSSEISILGGLKNGTINFVQKYWIYILVFLVSVAVIGVFVYKKMGLYFLKRKIYKMKAEERVLGGLMKKAQVERFKENKISGLVYNIRMKKYEERLSAIKRNLPVFVKRLKRG